MAIEAKPLPTDGGSATGEAASAVAAPGVMSAYPAPASLPTQTATGGVRFDFNFGARVMLPARDEGEASWKVRLRDLDSGNTLFEGESRGALVTSAKRFYVRFGVEVYDGEVQVLDHTFDCRDREVIVQFPVGTLGDTLAWFPYAARFAEVHGCRLTCAMGGKIIPLLQGAYPSIHFVTHEEMKERGLAEQAYATYSVGLFFDDMEFVRQPADFRLVGLHKAAAYILGVDPKEAPPRLHLTDDSRPIAEPYVCIAVQSSGGAKRWNNPNGWREVVAHAKALGYRVVCIDQKPVHGSGLVYTHIPHGVEDETGDRPLVERARWLRHASAFVGLASGLSWLAWAAGAPTVLISGFSHPTTEFETPYRVINWHTCNSCWNDPRERFDHMDFMWCPRHQNTPRHFECTRKITSHHVKAMLDRALACDEARARGIAAPAG